MELTQTVKKGGCAAKLPAGSLRKVLSALSLPKPRELVVGTETLDDACLWELGDGRLLVQTLDFFTPIVDDPFDFGAIAAANSVSDVYAMGGTPALALTILAFPMAVLPEETLVPLMKGAMSVLAEAGIALAGGHTIDDETLKLGFSVTGFVEKAKAWRNSGARPGDRLILTKGLGTGTIATAIKAKEAKPEWITSAITSMKRLNRAPELLRETSVHAATDITGFGLGGHALQMAQASGVAFEIELERLPRIAGAWDALQGECFNRAHKTNGDYIAPHARFETSEPLWEKLVTDAQTSGGLLLSVRPDEADAALRALRARFPETAEIGAVTAARDPSTRLRFF